MHQEWPLCRHHSRTIVRIRMIGRHWSLGTAHTWSLPRFWNENVTYNDRVRCSHSSSAGFAIVYPASATGLTFSKSRAPSSKPSSPTMSPLPISQHVAFREENELCLSRQIMQCRRVDVHVLRHSWGRRYEVAMLGGYARGARSSTSSSGWYS